MKIKTKGAGKIHPQRVSYLKTSDFERTLYSSRWLNTDQNGLKQKVRPYQPIFNLLFQLGKFRIRFFVLFCVHKTVLWYFHICKDNLIMLLAVVWLHVSMVFIITTPGVKPGSANTALLGNKLEVNSGRSGCHKDWGRPIILHLRNTIVLSKLKMVQMHNCQFTRKSCA